MSDKINSTAYVFYVCVAGANIRCGKTKISGLLRHSFTTLPPNRPHLLASAPTARICTARARRSPRAPARLRTHLIHRPRRRHRSAPASAVLCPAVPPTFPLRTAHLYRTRPPRRSPLTPPRSLVHPPRHPSPRRNFGTADFQFFAKYFKLCGQLAERK